MISCCRLKKSSPENESFRSTFSLLISVLLLAGAHEAQGAVHDPVPEIRQPLPHVLHRAGHVLDQPGLGRGLLALLGLELVVGVGVEPVRPADALGQGVDLVPHGLAVVRGVAGVDRGPVAAGGLGLVAAGQGEAGEDEAHHRHTHPRAGLGDTAAAAVNGTWRGMGSTEIKQ